jgi:hypothetical protein
VDVSKLLTAWTAADAGQRAGSVDLHRRILDVREGLRSRLRLGGSALLSKLLSTRASVG